MPGLREDITKTFQRLSSKIKLRGPHTPESQTVPDLIGQTLGSYRILRRLGSGGMGHVYLALDTRLGRHSALKFLSNELIAEEEMLKRLQIEARAASSLNHPNILTIYEIAEVGGRHFIASEFVDGVTLRVAIQNGGFTVGWAVEIVRQITSALIAAHQAHVVHRDLKPGNIMIRPDGYVKVIDFGLAKTIRLRAGAGAVSRTLTRPGTIIGTVDYMSPEQARGESVDHRSDIWSLGVILYELLTKRRPFEGVTENHLIVGILDAKIPPLPNRETLPAGLPEIVERALSKAPGGRYQSASDLLADLQKVDIGSERLSFGPKQFVSPPHQKRTALVVGVVSALFLIVAGMWYLSRPNWFEVSSVRQLTFNGRTLLSAISPDGRYLAYVVGDPGGIETLLLKQIEAGSSEYIKIPGRKTSYRGISFSADSQYLYEVEDALAGVGKLYSIPILGERSATPLLIDVDGAVSASPDGTKLAFVDRVMEKQESRLEIANIDGSARHVLLSVKGAKAGDYTISRNIAWSPRGDQIATFLHGESSVYLDFVKLNGREDRKKLQNWRTVGQPCWTRDGRAVIVSVAMQNEGNNQAQVRQVAASGPEWRDVTKDLAGFRSPSITRDGKSLAVVKLESKATLWVSDRGNFSRGQSSVAEAEQYSNASAPTLAWQDDRHVIISSRQNGYPNLWSFDSDTQTRSALVNESSVEQGAAVIPESKCLVFASNRSGKFHIWKFNPETNVFTQLTSGIYYDESPSVSPNGKRVLYTSWVSNRPTLYTVSPDGGQSIPVGKFLASHAVFSPDGQKIVCQTPDPKSSKWTVAVIDLRDPDHPRFFPDIEVPVRWAPGGNALTTVRTDQRGVSNLWNVPLDGSESSKLTNFEEQAISTFSWSNHGDRVACIRISQNSDVALYSANR